MRRLWIGVGFLAVILAVGIVLTVAFGRIHTPISEDLRQASQQALEQNWEKATALADSARAAWGKYQNFVAAVADHEPLEQMRSLLEQLQVYAQQHRTADFSAVCVELASMAEAILESQKIMWWNLL